MMLTMEQRKVVEENMGLVGKVIKDKVRGLSRSGVLTYDDLFQIGCIGLCKAAATDRGGCFSTYAYRLIWNEICDELIRISKRTAKEQSFADIQITDIGSSTKTDWLYQAELRQSISDVKKRSTGVISKGITCLELAAQGYSSKEMSQAFHVEAATIRVWMSKARHFLRLQSDLQDLAALGAE